MADARLNPFKPITAIPVGEIEKNGLKTMPNLNICGIKTNISAHVICQKTKGKNKSKQNPFTPKTEASESDSCLLQTD